MLLQIGALVVYGALLILVTGTTAAYPRARLARRMLLSVADTTKELTSAKGGKIFTNSYLDKHMAAPGEPGLTLMEFHEHAGRQIGVDSKDMDRFVNSLISKSMPEEYKSEQFKLQDIYEDHLKWLKSKDNGVEASKALFKKMAGTPAESLNNYYTKMMDGKDIDHSEGMKFLEWNCETQKWRSQYEDTIKLNTRDLLKGFMRWASKDLKLKDNIYVHEWQNGMLETGSRRKLLEGLEPTSWPRNKLQRQNSQEALRMRQTYRHNSKNPVIGRPVNKPPGTALYSFWAFVSRVKFSVKDNPNPIKSSPLSSLSSVSDQGNLLDNQTKAPPKEGQLITTDRWVPIATRSPSSRRKRKNGRNISAEQQQRNLELQAKFPISPAAAERLRRVREQLASATGRREDLPSSGTDKLEPRNDADGRQLPSHVPSSSVEHVDPCTGPCRQTPMDSALGLRAGSSSHPSRDESTGTAYPHTSSQREFSGEPGFVYGRGTIYPPSATATTMLDQQWNLFQRARQARNVPLMRTALQQAISTQELLTNLVDTRKCSGNEQYRPGTKYQRNLSRTTPEHETTDARDHLPGSYHSATRVPLTPPPPPLIPPPTTHQVVVQTALQDGDDPTTLREWCAWPSLSPEWESPWSHEQSAKIQPRTTKPPLSTISESPPLTSPLDDHKVPSAQSASDPSSTEEFFNNINSQFIPDTTFLLEDKIRDLFSTFISDLPKHLNTVPSHLVESCVSKFESIVHKNLNEMLTAEIIPSLISEVLHHVEKNNMDRENIVKQVRHDIKELNQKQEHQTSYLAD
ncbi:hypothetical protein H4Q26_010319 [Puccinia striiformis f. sp. tritici PST-130]|nr:hypothetical protein H4Q26_010319 [Puccinia striiformis f. sp. tritici PST-130]